MAAIEAFFLGITIHTAEQKIAQAEIDAVVGRDRLPTFADRECLPYCEALCLEIMRRYTLGPLGKLIFQTPSSVHSDEFSFFVWTTGLPHVSREDDVHDGYFIPKGTIVIPNNWYVFLPQAVIPRMRPLTIVLRRQFFRDPKTYPNPETFAPERFLGPQKQLDPRKYLFGYGRRCVCPSCPRLLHSYVSSPVSCPTIRICPGESWTNAWCCEVLILSSRFP